MAKQKSSKAKQEVRQHIFNDIIEDVIVDGSARGQGLGESLVRHCLEAARARGACGVALTSNPKRESANRLYQRMGFQKRETNAYYYKFE